MDGVTNWFCPVIVPTEPVQHVAEVSSAVPAVAGVQQSDGNSGTSVYVIHRREFGIARPSVRSTVAGGIGSYSQGNSQGY